MKRFCGPENAKVVVTGGGGFIGSALCEALLANGCRVICADNFSTGKRENVSDFLKNPNFTLAEGDVCDEGFMERICAGADFLLHEAALGSVPRSMEHPAATMKANVAGTASVFHAAAKAGIRRIIYASSSSVYGDAAELPKRENRTGKALSPYALSKQMDEQIAELFARICGLNTIGLRYFNVFGRRQDPSGAYAAVIPRFADALIRRRAPVIHGDGSTTRDFTYVDDVVQANLKALTADGSACGKTFNVASCREISLLQLFRTMRDILAETNPAIAGIEPEHDSPRPGDVPRSLADVSSAKKYLGYAPEYEFGEAMRLTLSWYLKKSRT